MTSPDDVGRVEQAGPLSPVIEVVVIKRRLGWDSQQCRGSKCPLHGRLTVREWSSQSWKVVTCVEPSWGPLLHVLPGAFQIRPLGVDGVWSSLSANRLYSSQSSLGVLGYLGCATSPTHADGDASRRNSSDLEPVTPS